MSGIGFSPFDCIKVAELLVRGWNLLHGEAVEGFEKHLDEFKDWAKQVQRLASFIEMDKAGRTALFHRQLFRMTATLDQMSKKTEGLKRYLGPKPSAKKFLIMIKKLTWPHHDKVLNNYQRDLLSQCLRLNTDLGIHNL
jgi:hypothetical protein